MRRQEGRQGGRSARRVRLRSWWSWVTQPWRTPAVALALIVAFGLPALVLSAGAMFRTSAADVVARRSIDALAPGPAGFEVGATGSLGGPDLDAFDAAVTERLAAVDELGPVEAVLISERVTIAPVGSEPPVRAEARVLAGDAATAAVEVTAGRPDESGVLVPRSLADERGLEVGDLVVLGSAAPVPVSGTYRDLWDGPVDPWWDALPDDDVPRFQRAFGTPSFQLVIAPRTVLAELGLSGRVRLAAPLAAAPRQWVELTALRDEYDDATRALALDPVIVGPYRGFATDPTAPISSFTALDPVVDRAAGIIADLERPVRAATVAGVAVGIVLSTLGAVFLLRRRRNDFRLLAADGDGAARFFGRAIVQYGLPAVAGSLIGVVAAWAVVTTLGPSGSASIGVVAWPPVLGVAAVAVVAAALLTAALAVRLTDSMDERVGTIGTRGLLFVVGAVVVMWVQVGRASGDDVDPIAVAFPLVGVVAGVAVAVVGLRAAFGALRRTGARLPTPLFLAWRSLTASEAGSMALTGAIGVATGLAVLSSSFVTSIDDATTAKASAAVGARSRLDTLSDVDPATLPAGVTLVRTATYADAVVWTSAFGTSAEEVLAALDADPDDPAVVPAIAVDGWSIPTQSAWGHVRKIPYRLVATVAAVPLAADGHATLIVRADVLERWARDAFAAGDTGDPIESITDELLDRPTTYESPLDGFADTVLARLPIDELTRLAAANDWRRVEVTSLEQATGSVDTAAIRWAFDFLGLLAVIAGVVALVAMTFHLAERRRQREVAAAMAHQMGIRPRTAIGAAVVEMVGLVVVAVVAGTASALITARHVFPVFEPDPRRPPSVPLTMDVAGTAVVGALAIVAVVVVAAWAQRAAGRTPTAEVLRG